VKLEKRKFERRISNQDKKTKKERDSEEQE